MKRARFTQEDVQLAKLYKVDLQPETVEIEDVEPHEVGAVVISDVLIEDGCATLDAGEFTALINQTHEMAATIRGFQGEQTHLIGQRDDAERRCTWAMVGVILLGLYFVVDGMRHLVPWLLRID
jgi:hypothetical protein